MEVNPALFDSLFTEELFVISPSTTIILDQPWESITDAERNLLEKILAAIKQTLNSVAIRHQDPLDLSVLAEKPSKVIYFGKPVKGIPYYEIMEANEVLVISSESLKNLSSNEDARKKLWQALKKQFSV